MQSYDNLKGKNCDNEKNKKERGKRRKEREEPLELRVESGEPLRVES